MAQLSPRLFGWLTALLVLALPLIGLLEGWYGTHSWPIDVLRVDADYKHVEEKDVRQAAAPYLGRGFFATRLTRIRAAVEDLPWVAHASVRKIWPDTLMIHIDERHAFARWNDDSIVDRDGKVFVAPVGLSDKHMPALGGPDDSSQKVMQFYFDIKHKLAHKQLNVSGVKLDARGSWQITLANGALLYLGDKQVQQRLERFMSVYAKLASTHKQEFVYVDLRYSNGFAVKWPDEDKEENGGSST